MPKNAATAPLTRQEIAFAHLVLSGTMTDRRAAETVGLDWRLVSQWPTTSLPIPGLRPAPLSSRKAKRPKTIEFYRIL